MHTYDNRKVILMKKTIGILLAATLLASAALSGCAAATPPATTPAAPAPDAIGASSASADVGGFDSSFPITVISREEGSGTRGAFIELFEVQEKGADGTKTDMTTKEAVIAPKTDVMLANVAGDEYSIGYVSLGSLGATVKAMQIDGVDATAENVKTGAYKIARPFNIATKGEATGLAADFISYIMSAEGQEIVLKGGYIKIDEAAPAYAGTKPTGKIVVAGSSSVSPVMEKLAEAYQKLNTGAVIEIQQTDSTAGMTAAVDGTCDIGMASRALKDSETAVLTATAIANDGIAVITAPANPTIGMTGAAVKGIFTGAITTWADVAAS